MRPQFPHFAPDASSTGGAHCLRPPSPKYAKITTQIKLNKHQKTLSQVAVKPAKKFSNSALRWKEVRGGDGSGAVPDGGAVVNAQEY